MVLNSLIKFEGFFRFEIVTYTIDLNVISKTALTIKAHDLIKREVKSVYFFDDDFVYYNSSSISIVILALRLHVFRRPKWRFMLLRQRRFQIHTCAKWGVLLSLCRWWKTNLWCFVEAQCLWKRLHTSLRRRTWVWINIYIEIKATEVGHFKVHKSREPD